MKFTGHGGMAFAAIAIAAAAWGTSARAVEVIELRTAAQQATAPKFVAADGAATGLCIDIHRAIEKQDPGLRITGDQQWRPLPRLEAELRSGALDIGCGFMRTREREADLSYAEPALFAVSYHLVARSDDPVDVVSWDDVRNLGDKGTILAIHGFGQVARLRELGGLAVDSGATDAATNLRKLLAGRGRFYYHRSPGIAAEIRKAGLDGKVRVLPAMMDTQRFYLVAGRHLAASTMTRLNRALAQLDASGELKRLFGKWYEEVPLEAPLPKVALARR
ncbi:transporter substrate-binding domain-containing protein [Pseudoduganella ginsengisoli]|uniref:Transporter substrate-binding domain-containing protein n=1 Tax=Pseudoduganella ginsengisoli TaxID=1462440 RepID=A0A6L6Q574_9BURK|nr:transporter substrate-binding domain-containing protein [Pseudoduganella ginsengisoli]MTW04428.1 transporter substrate-binding domain-containing protein [Pseudoduganella ginsengisoli]